MTRRGNTQQRSIRIDADLWDKAQARAAEEGDNLSAIIRDALRQYIQEGEDTRG